jgi:hypothetical protein
MYHLFAYEREAFMAHYHKRSNIETAFSMIKGKFGSELRSKSGTGQINEVLCKVLAHNICVFIAGDARAEHPPDVSRRTNERGPGSLRVEAEPPARKWWGGRWAPNPPQNYTLNRSDESAMNSGQGGTGFLVQKSGLNQRRPLGAILVQSLQGQK